MAAAGISRFGDKAAVVTGGSRVSVPPSRVGRGGDAPTKRCIQYSARPRVLS